MREQEAAATSSAAESPKIPKDRYIGVDRWLKFGSAKLTIFRRRRTFCSKKPSPDDLSSGDGSRLRRRSPLLPRLLVARIDQQIAPVGRRHGHLVAAVVLHCPLHIEWQQKLIGMIRELNPNVQLILTTHSPAVIMEGWLDAVTEVSDISTEI